MRDVQYLNGRYRLIEPLGAGGMSVVWRAYDEVLGRPVAVKLLGSSRVADPRSRELIRDEARTAARLSHPHITAVHDYGESRVDGLDAAPYVVMELVDGRSLEDVLELGPLPWPTAVGICADVASALAAVHARGLVHRDIKPANIMLTERGAKVVDFGISAIAGDQADTLGRELLGTPAYLAPERLTGAPTAPATDMYALGLLLYKTLTGRLPWDADTPATMLSAHRYKKPAPLPPIDGLPADVGDLCLSCLAKKPAERPTAEEAGRRLAAALPVVVPAPEPSRKTRRWSAPSRPVRAGAAAVGVLAGALVFFNACGHGGGPVAQTGAARGVPVGSLVERLLADYPVKPAAAASHTATAGTGNAAPTAGNGPAPPAAGNDKPDGKPDGKPKGKDKEGKDK